MARGARKKISNSEMEKVKTIYRNNPSWGVEKVFQKCLSDNIFSNKTVTVGTLKTYYDKEDPKLSKKPREAGIIQGTGTVIAPSFNALEGINQGNKNKIDPIRYQIDRRAKLRQKVIPHKRIDCITDEARFIFIPLFLPAKIVGTPRIDRRKEQKIITLRLEFSNFGKGTSKDIKSLRQEARLDKKFDKFSHRIPDTYSYTLLKNQDCIEVHDDAMEIDITVEEDADDRRPVIAEVLPDRQKIGIVYRVISPENEKRQNQEEVGIGNKLGLVDLADESGSESDE